MRQLLKFICIAFVFLFGNISLLASEPIVLNPLPIVGDEPGDNSGDKEDPKIKDDPTKPNKHRTPAAPVFCEIDFEDSSISAPDGFLDSIIEYQVWDAEGVCCIVASPVASFFVSSLSALSPDEYLIVFVSPSARYCGHILL